MSHGQSEVSFKNDYGHRIYVAYMRRDFDCLADGWEQWEVRGWINLDTGETEYRANSTENQWFYYYAEAADGAIWIGPYIAKVRKEVFHTCVGAGHAAGLSWYDVGMRELDTVEWAGVRFIP